MSPYTRAIASGTVRVSGPLADYTHLGVFLTGVEGTLTLFDYQLKNDGPISLTFQDNAVSIGRFRLTGEGTNLELSGGMSVTDSTINLQANGDASLAILQGPNMHGGGRAVLRASATGSFSDPSISGYADIEGGSFRYRALPRSFTDIVGRVTFDGNAVSLDGLKAKFGDGDVKFSGNIALKSFMPDQFNLSAVGTAMRLRYPEGFSSTVNADLSLTGPVAAPLLSGRVDVLYAAYTQTIDTDAGIVMFAAGAAGAGAGEPGEEGVFEAIPESSYPLTFNIQIRANHTLHIDNRKTATLTGSADLSYRGTLDRPSLTGHIDIDSGEVFINGNRFKVLPGTIQFSNPNKFDPFFDITAETRPRAQGQTFNISVHLTGTKTSLTPTFNSDPWLSTVDIITLIFGGVPDVSRSQERSIALTAAGVRDARAERRRAVPAESDFVARGQRLRAHGRRHRAVHDDSAERELVQPAQPVDARDRRQAALAQPLHDLRARPQLVAVRSDPRRIRAERAHLLDPLAQRRSHVRARFPRAPRVLMRGRWRLAAIVGVLVLAGARPVSAQQPDHDRAGDRPADRVGPVRDRRPARHDGRAGVARGRQGRRSAPSRHDSQQRAAPVERRQLRRRVRRRGRRGRGRRRRAVRLSARRPVDSLAFTEDTGLDPKELQKRVRDQYGGLPTNVPPGKLSQSVREILNDEGYLRADVSVSTTKRTNPDRATLVFAVAAGDRAGITQVEVNNGATSVFSSEQLRQRTGIVAGRPYRLGDINIALAAIRDELQAKGYYAAVASIEPVVSPDLKSVMVTLTVDAGPRVKINWTGDPPPAGREEDLVPIKRERAADDDLLEDSRVRVEEALQADGYVNARVALTKDTSTPGVLVVTYHVTRGPRFRVDHLVIPTGLHMTTTTLEALLPTQARRRLQQSQDRGSARRDPERVSPARLLPDPGHGGPRDASAIERGRRGVGRRAVADHGRAAGLRRRDSVCARHDADPGAGPAIAHAIEGTGAVHSGADDR